MKLLLGKHELALQNLAKNYTIEYLTTEVELALPTFKSYADHRIIEYLTLRLGAKLQATNRVPRPVDRGTATRYGG